MSVTEVEIRLVWAWAKNHIQARREAIRQDDPERGDGLLVWVIMTALLAAAAIAIVAIIVTKAKNKANDTQTQ